MIGKTNLGGSGGGLNFKVVGDTSVPAGKENLIWVNTATAITNWVVSPNQPGNPAAGTVWIQDGSSNGINIVKKNAVEVFPSGCRQYVNGAWRNVEAYLFRNGGWVQFSFMIIPITLTVSHDANGNDISIVITDKNTGATITSGSLSGAYQFATMTNKEYAFTYSGGQARLVCTVGSSTPRFTATLYANGEQRSTFSGGGGGNSSFAWSFSQDGLL